MKSHIILAGLLGLSLFNIASAENDKGEDQYLSRVRQLTLEGAEAGKGIFRRTAKTSSSKANERRGILFIRFIP